MSRRKGEITARMIEPGLPALHCTGNERLVRLAFRNTPALGHRQGIVQRHT
jgi:hypothetical protein